MLSDIHVGDLAQSVRMRAESPPDTRVSVQSAASDMASALSSAGLKPSIVVVPGDLTSRGSPWEFQFAYDFLEEARRQLGVERERLLITYGNHDVDWLVCGLGGPSAGRRGAYCQLAAHIGAKFAPGAPPTVPGPVVGSGIFRFPGIEFVVLNSGIECYALDGHAEPRTQYPHGKIGESQLRWLRSLRSSDKGVTCIAIIHHHIINIPYPKYAADISQLEEGAEVRRELGRIGIDMIIHGHRHHPHLTTAIETDWAQPISVMCAGSFGVNSSHRASGCIPNTFHVVKIEEAADRGNSSGRVFTFQQQADEMWSLLSAGEKDVGVDAIQWFGIPDAEACGSDVISSFITPLATQAALTGVADLPKHETLPLAMRCMRLESLNAKLSASARSAGCRMMGKYPDDCVLTHKR